MAKGFTIPKEDQKAYKTLIQRANAHIRKRVQYIEEHNIKTFTARRTIGGLYFDKKRWTGAKTPVSSSVKFNSLQEYKDMVEYLNELAPATGEKVIDRIEAKVEEYRRAIHNSLLDIVHVYSIPVKGDTLPAEVLAKINSLTPEQVLNFYGSSDPNEDAIISEFETDKELEVGNYDSFIHLIDARIGELKRFI